MDRRTVLGFAIGPIGAAALSFISLPLMTWIFPPEVIGKLSMLQVTIQFSTLLFCLGMDQAYVREYHESIGKPALLLNATLPGFLLMLVVLGALFAAAPTTLSHLLYDDVSVRLSLLSAGCLVVAYLSRFLSLILRMQDRGLAFSMSQLLSKALLLAIVLSYVLLPISHTFWLLLLAQGAALLLTLLVFCWNTRHDWLPALRTRLERPLFNHLFAFGWPLIFGGVASWGLMAMDRIFLRGMSSYEELAIYSVSASIASGVTIFSGIFNIIWAPLVFKWVATGVDTSRVDVIARQVSVIVLLLVCLAGAFSWVLPYLLPTEYRQVMYLVPGCMVAPLLYTLSEVTGIGITVSRRTVYSFLASLGAVAVNAGLCFLLVPRMGATGAMISTACAFWVFYMLRSQFSSIVWRSARHSKAHVYSVLALAFAGAYGLIGSHFRDVSFVAWFLLLPCVIYVDRATWASLSTLLRQQLDSRKQYTGG